MKYLLDTNAVIAVLKDRPESVRKRLKRELAKGSSIAFSSIVMFELWYGAFRSERPRENTERLRVLLSGGIDVFAFEEEDALEAGRLRAHLELDGTPIGPYDLLIAAQALRLDMTLVTANVSEFGRVRTLRWQDWSA